MSILRARWVLPVASPPIENGEIVIEEGRIAAVRPQGRATDADTTDLGDAILLPGLVNAHTHLEYTALRGFLEDVAFFPWIRALNDAKSSFSAADWEVSARLGALECLASGITTIGDNTDAGASMPAAIETGLRAVIYQEIFGIDHRDAVEPKVAELEAKVAELRARVEQADAGDRVSVGISPHATYTIRPALFSALREYAQRVGLPISIHIAESPAESELIERGSGPFGEMFARRGILWLAPGVTPTRYIYDQGMLGQRTVAVHCVHQTEDDIALIANSGAAIVHCPKSNAKLGAGIAPLAEWLAQGGITVGLGTDSAVSNNTLDLFEEMRFAIFLQRAAREAVEGVSARQVVEMATMGGARALGLSQKIGVLAPGYAADITAVRLDSVHATPAEDPYSALVYAARADDVCLTMVDGQVLYRDGAWATSEARNILEKARSLRSRVIAERGHAPQA